MLIDCRLHIDHVVAVLIDYKFTILIDHAYTCSPYLLTVPTGYLILIDAAAVV